MRHVFLDDLQAGDGTGMSNGRPRLLLAGRLRPLRFALTGGSAGALQLVLLALLTRHAVNAFAANLLAFLIAAQLNFALSTVFTWRDRHSGGVALLRRWPIFHGSIAGMAVINMMVFALAHRTMPALPASALGIAAAAIGNYWIGDRVVFAASPLGPAGTATRPASPRSIRTTCDAR